jgi:hypothetical protein
MTQEQLEKANELREIIKKTKLQLKELHHLRGRRNPKDKVHFNDGQYSLTICEHGDGSGCKAELNRYLGNAELLDGIIEILEKQIIRFNEMFEQL